MINWGGIIMMIGLIALAYALGGVIGAVGAFVVVLGYNLYLEGF